MACAKPAPHDLVIVGGGIAGLGLFERAAQAGLSVLLLERGRAGGATTAVTSGLFHGGLRYLPYDVATSYSMCREIARLRSERPELLTRRAFLWPVYRGQRYGFGLVDSLQDYYDLLGRWRASRPHVRLSAREALAVEPGLEPAGLKGALSFDEWQVDVPALVASLTRAGRVAGGTLLEGRRVFSFARNGGPVIAARTYDPDGRIEEHAGEVFVNAAGPWAEEVAGLAGAKSVRLTLRKGVHLVVDGPAPRCGLIFPGPAGRYIGVYPREGGFLVGPTDESYEGSPDAASVSAEEERGLREALRRVLPACADRPARTIVGLRPIFKQRAAAALLSRDHRVDDHAGEGLSNLISVTGGKLTSHRRMAEETLAAVLAKLGRPAAPAQRSDAAFPWTLLERRRAGLSLGISAALLSYYAVRRLLGAGGGAGGLNAFRRSYGWPEGA